MNLRQDHERRPGHRRRAAVPFPERPAAPAAGPAARPGRRVPHGRAGPRHGGEPPGGTGRTADRAAAELLRPATPTAHPARREPRGRPRPAALRPARPYAAGEPPARRPAAEAFTAAARETAGPSVPPSSALRRRLPPLTARPRPAARPTSARWAPTRSCHRR
ncbi:hypothetical protein ACF073_17570 [Streptomyces sp. NPDC015171]|uniref:hypothetical protein n=1 Tax=Streptomyces sp. NPDC015171 TaxID=3364945 RepID=UPI0036F87313